MEQNMQVLKRDGHREDVAFEKVQQRISKAAAGLTVNTTKVAQGVLSRIVDGITTTELDNITSNLAYAWSTTHPDYAELASRIAISNHQRNTPSRFVDAVNLLDAVTDRSGAPASLLDPAFVKVVNDNADRIEAHIDYERDFNIDYFGFKTLEKAYLLRDSDRKVLERPQHLWMRVAVGLWPDDLEQAFKTYDLMSMKYYTHATPTLFNAGTKRPQLSSCFLIGIGDSIQEIYKTLTDCALISQYGGGIGLHVSNIRAKGSMIRGTGGISNGLVPMLRVFNNTARYVDQCFAPDTKVLTDQGEIRIADIIPGMKVLTSGTKETVDEFGKHFAGTQGSQYNVVTKLVKHDYSGEVLEIQVDHMPVIVTPAHPVLAIENSSALPIQTQYENGLVTLDYIEIGKLKVGDALVTFDGAKPVFHSIESIRSSTYTGPLYDLEVDGTHDYTVAHLGLAHNGGGKRNGSFAMYLEPWHADIEDFLELKKNTGSEEERARDLFYAMWVPDLFMERVDANGDWTLFCPNEAPGLADVVGDEFKALYERYEREGRGKRTIKAQKLWFHILDSQIETGTPYLCYKDAANKKSNQQNLGVIKSSNLCVAPETPITTKNGVFAISTLVDQDVEVWNGQRWSLTTVRKTGTAQTVISFAVQDYCVDEATGRNYTVTKTIQCTPYHKFILEDSTRVDASTLTEGTKLVVWYDHNGMKHSQTVYKVYAGERTCDTYCFNEPEFHAGVFNGILTGNCTEIIEYSDAQETAVCNLASLSLPAFISDGAFDFKKLRTVTATVIKNLDRVIDINYYPIPEAERSNRRHRPVGLGVQGLSDVFAMLGLAWESEEATLLNKRIFAHMYYAAVQSSIDLAAKHGTYETYVGSPAHAGKLQYDLWNVAPYKEDELDWDSLANDARRIGLRNSLLVAPMPTASTSQILGNCECIEPYATHIFTRRTLAGEFIIVNKHLVRALAARGLWSTALKDAIIANNGSVAGLPDVPEDIQRVFKTVWEIKQKTLIDMAADRGPYICQSQSLNLFLGDPDYRKLTSMHFYAWRKGLKTGIYYLRTRAVASAQKFTVEPVKAIGAVAEVKEEEGCVMCSS
jgi:ribonucleotide reductase alpha subunit